MSTLTPGVRLRNRNPGAGSTTRWVVPPWSDWSHGSRPSGSAGADPLLGAVGERLVLPDGHLVLEVVDQLAAGVEGLAAVGAGHGHDDGQVSDAQIPHAVHGRERPYGKLCDDLLGDPPQLGLGAGMGRIRQLVHVGPAVVVAHGPDEQR